MLTALCERRQTDRLKTNYRVDVRSKQNVRDKVGPLEDNAGNIITEGVLMAEELNMHFSSVFTREDTSSLPVPETKFNGTEGERLGQLVITPEVLANKINSMKDNKSPGVDGIAPDMLQNLNWPSLEIRRTRVRLIMFYKIIHHVVAIHPLDTLLLPTTVEPLLYDHPQNHIGVVV